ncbi:MAG: DUF4919 domain-containing protein, partial [Acidobacteria bacterium]|nr:DUF4919 domain-containing protein [Acidobacteriota bacterium]
NMTHRPLSACILVLLTFLSIPAQSQQTPPVAGKSTFNELVEKAKKGDRSVDFTELRIAFYESANYNPYTPMMTYRSLYGALAQTNYAEAIKIAESVLEKNFVEVNAHMVAQIAYRESGNAERAQFHKFMADGLLNSIKSKGDGKSKDTAFEVISINEEYGLLRSMSLRPIKQSLLQDKGHRFDALTVIDPQTNQESVVYFNVDKPFNWEDRKKKG